MPTIDINGVAFHYTKQGSGPPLLMIHGTGGSADAFATVIDALAATYTVIAYDRRAFSRSTAQPHPPVKYLANHAADAAALLKALNAQPVHVLGWSAGGLVAVALAIEHPDAVKSLVLYEPPYLLKSHAGLGFSLTFLQLMALKALGLERAAARKFYRAVFARKDGINDFDALQPALRDAILANAHALLAELNGDTGESFELTALRDLPQPISLLTCTQSAPMFAAAADRIAKTVPLRRRIDAPNAGHAMQLTAPRAFIEAVQDLLRRH